MDDDLSIYEVQCDSEADGYIIKLYKKVGADLPTLLRQINPPESEQIMINLEPLTNIQRITLLKRLARHYDEIAAAKNVLLERKRILENPPKDDLSNEDMQNLQ